MKLEQLKHLIEIDKQKSISKAAKVLYIGQSTLSASLTSLEDEIGVRLFERTSSGVIPTAEGKEAVQLAKQTMDSVQQILSLGKQERELYGKVVVSIGQAYSFLAGDLLLKFKARHPKAELDLQVETPPQQRESILSGKTKVALALFPTQHQDSIRIIEQQFQCEIVGNCNFCVYVGREHSLAQKESVSWQDLKGENFVTTYWGTGDILKQQINPEKEVMIVSDKDAINQLIYEGGMIAYLPELFTKQNLYCQYGLIKPVAVAENPAQTSAVMVLISLDHHSQTLLEQSAVQVLHEVLQSL